MSKMYKMLCDMGQEEAVRYLDDITSSKFINHVKDTLDELGLSLSFENVYLSCVVLDGYPFTRTWENSFDGLLDNNESCSLSALSKKELSYIFTHAIRFYNHPEENIGFGVYNYNCMRPFGDKEDDSFKNIYRQYEKFFYNCECHTESYNLTKHSYHLYISTKLYELYKTKIIVDETVREKLNYIDFDKYTMFFKNDQAVAEENYLLGYLFGEVENQAADKVPGFLNDQTIKDNVKSPKLNPDFYNNFKQDIFVDKKGKCAVLEKKRHIVRPFIIPTYRSMDKSSVLSIYNYGVYKQSFVTISKTKYPILYNNYNLSFIANLAEFMSDNHLFGIVNTFNAESRAKVVDKPHANIGGIKRFIYSSKNKDLMHDVLKSCVYLREVLTKTGFLNPNHHSFDESDILFPKIEACVKNKENKIFITFDIDKSYYNITNIHELFTKMPDNKTKICFLSLYRLIRDTRTKSLPITVATPLLFKMFMSNIIEKNDDTLMFVDDCFIYGKDKNDIASKLLKLLECFKPYFKINSFKVIRKSKDKGVAFMNKLFNFDDYYPMKESSIAFDSEAAMYYFCVLDLFKTSSINNMSECKICLQTVEKMGVLTCRHLVCDSCRTNLKNCPFCREPITSWDVIYTV